MATTALVILAEDFEELEAVTIIDLLVRAGVEVTTAGLTSGPVRASRKTVILPNTTLDEASQKTYDLIALPGGLPGADHLSESELVIELLKKQTSENKLVGAICAAPRALVQANILNDKSITCYPGSLDHLKETLINQNVSVNNDAVVVDLPIITSRGPGTAIDFALELINQLKGEVTRTEVEASLVRSL